MCVYVYAYTVYIDLMSQQALAGFGMGQGLPVFLCVSVPALALPLCVCVPLLKCWNVVSGRLSGVVYVNRHVHVQRDGCADLSTDRYANALNPRFMC